MRERDAIDLHVGSRLRYRRMHLGMSQETLAAAVGLRFQQIQKYEKGQNRIGAGRLFRLAKALRVPLDYFFEDLPETDKADLEAARRPIAFLGTPEGHELANSFIRISDPATRRKLIELVRSLAQGESASEVQ